ncbi:His-Xaa-Ser system radical SAM maturase HxsC [Bacteroides faecium]|nr:His-Xaa-Ser system radical SAM maturase HxsC [Bacteroides faecium]
MMNYRPFDINSNDNTLFVTSQCNNNCIMCCQPPKPIDDIDELYDYNLTLIKNAPKDIPIIGISGGEPTLLGKKLISLIAEIRNNLPNTEIHMLSNGRKFCNVEFTHEIKEVAGDKLIVGIPLHSDYFKDHDMIAGKKNAFNDTMYGLYNLAYEHISIELRVVIISLNYKRLLPIAEFIHKNLPFTSWTAFMGMEYVGYAVTNSSKIWIEPIEYIHLLTKAVKYLDEWHYDVAIYNIPLCLLPQEYHHFVPKSISDWKTKYLNICQECKMKDKCCGLFSTSIKSYNGLKAY